MGQIVDRFQHFIECSGSEQFLSGTVQYGYRNKEMKINTKWASPKDFPKHLEFFKGKLSLEENEQPSKSTKHVGRIGLEKMIIQRRIQNFEEKFELPQLIAHSSLVPIKVWSLIIVAKI